MGQAAAVAGRRPGGQGGTMDDLGTVDAVALHDPALRRAVAD